RRRTENRQSAPPGTGCARRGLLAARPVRADRDDGGKIIISDLGCERMNDPTRLPDADRTLLIVDDDKPFCDRLARALAARGFVPRTANSVAEGAAALAE